MPARVSHHTKHACMPALVEKDNRLIQHCRASKYKNGPVIGMRELYLLARQCRINRLSFSTRAGMRACRFADSCVVR